MTIPFRGALGAAVLLTCSSSAFAHAVMAVREASPGAPYRGVVQVMHGCAGSPTVSVRVTIPDGVAGARPMPKPGWALSTVKGPYARPYSNGHSETAEGVKEIVWTGGSVPDDQFDEFTFQAQIADGFTPGDVIRFPIVQTCAAGEARWTEIPAAGQDAHALRYPAPGVTVVAAAATAGSDTVKVGALTIVQPWMRATPTGATVAGGYVRITNTGAMPDRLVSASIPLAGRGEVHEMATVNGVMTMNEVAGGLTIPPGGTVELKPGGYHLMFMDLSSGPKAGDTVRGTLTFEKAGKVDVAFRVSPVGAPGPAGGAMSEHQHH